LLAAQIAHRSYNKEDGKNWAGKCFDFIKELGEEHVDPAQSCRAAIIWADGQTVRPEDLGKNETLLKHHIENLAEETHKKLKCEALVALAYVQYEIGTPEAVETAQGATQLAEEINDLPLQYEALSILSDIWVDNEENFEDAEKANLKAIRIAEKLRDSYRLAGTMASYAWLLTDLGRPAEAYEYGEKAVKLAERKKFPDDKNLKAFIYRMAATGYEAKREFKKALESYRKSLRLYTKLGAKVKMCWLYYDIGDCLAQMHRHPAAIYFFNKCLKKAKEIDNFDTWLWSLVSLADIDLLEVRVDLAARRLEEANEIVEDPERRATDQDKIEYKTSLSKLKFLQGDVESAKRLTSEILGGTKYAVDKFYANLNLGTYLVKTGPDTEALEQLTTSAKLALELNDPIWLALAHDQIGDLCNKKREFFEAVQHYEYSIRSLTGCYHPSGIEKIARKRDQVRAHIKKNILGPSHKIIALRHPYAASNGPLTISFVNRDIFLKKYFTHCLECDFCQDSCCSYGTDIDTLNMKNLTEVKEEILPFIRQSDQDWFKPELTYDAEFPGNQYSRTTVLGDRCIFISKDQRGCGLHRYAIAKGKDYHSIKPFVCTLFPVTFGNGILTTSDELDDNSLACAGSGYSAYRGVRKELEYYFGNEFVRELDEIEKRTLSSNQK
jgi:tetratricopeptide (TPR) repeat protein/Fe-S-cluster containining protein